MGFTAMEEGGRRVKCKEYQTPPCTVTLAGFKDGLLKRHKYEEWLAEEAQRILIEENVERAAISESTAGVSLAKIEPEEEMAVSMEAEGPCKPSSGQDASRETSEVAMEVDGPAACEGALPDTAGSPSGQQRAEKSAQERREEREQRRLKKQEEKARKRAEHLAELESKQKELEEERLNELQNHLRDKAKLDEESSKRAAEIKEATLKLEELTTKKHSLVLKLKSVSPCPLPMNLFDPCFAGWCGYVRVVAGVLAI